MPTPPTRPPAAQADRGRRGLTIVLVVLGVLIVSMGVFATLQLNDSERHVRAELEAISKRGAELEPDGCIDAVLAWRGGCEAIASMCDGTIGQLVDACMAARERGAYCAQNLDALESDTSRVAAMCAERGYTRRERARWKQCGMAVQAVAYHCRQRAGVGE